METTHSKTSRTKKPAPKIVVPSWDEVWDSFTASAKKTTIEAMNAEGWRTVDQVAKETELSRCRINQMANEGKLDRIKKRVWQSGLTREMNFVRPKATTCQ